MGVEKTTQLSDQEGKTFLFGDKGGRISVIGNTATIHIPSTYPKDRSFTILDGWELKKVGDDIFMQQNGASSFETTGGVIPGAILKKISLVEYLEETKEEQETKEGGDKIGDLIREITNCVGKALDYSQKS